MPGRDQETSQLHSAEQPEKPAVAETGDDPGRLCEKLTYFVPTDQRKTYDMRVVIREVVDNGHFLEISPVTPRT